MSSWGGGGVHFTHHQPSHGLHVPCHHGEEGGFTSLITNPPMASMCHVIMGRRGGSLHSSPTLPWPPCVMSSWGRGGVHFTHHHPYPDLHVSRGEGGFISLITTPTLASMCHGEKGGSFHSSPPLPWPPCVTGRRGVHFTHHHPYPGLHVSWGEGGFISLITTPTLASMCHGEEGGSFHSSPPLPWPPCVSQHPLSCSPFLPKRLNSWTEGYSKKSVSPPTSAAIFPTSVAMFF